MKFTYLGNKKLFLVMVLAWFYQIGHAQNAPIQPKSPFDSSLLVEKTDGTYSYNGVTFGPYLADLFTREEPFTDEITAVVSFDDAEIAKELRPLLKSKGGEFVGPEFVYIPVQGVNAHLNEVLAMTEIEGVAGVWLNRKMEQTLHQAVITSSVKDVWEDSDFTTLNDGIKLEGRGVGVVVNDSGFDGDDSDIQYTDESGEYIRMVAQARGNGLETDYNWIETPEPDTDQGSGHGSHCMGIIGGDGRHSNGKIRGVAPASTVIGYSSGAAILVLDGLGGFEYAIKHRKDYNIRIISNSFGSPGDTMFTTFNMSASPYNTASKACIDNDIIVVFAAGNGGPTDGKIGGNFLTAPWVIAVANGTKDGKLAGSSSPGRPHPQPNPDNHPSVREAINIDGVDYLWENRPAVTAPGTDIIAVRASTGSLQALSALNDASLQPSEFPYYAHMTGTSMACPHIAGIIALMVEANKDIEWRASKAILQRTAITSMEKEIYQRGTGYVNAYASVAAAFHGLCDTTQYVHPDEDATPYEKLYGLRTNRFGFDDDPWKTCPLNIEVDTRMKDEIPIPGDAPVTCTSPTVITDVTGADEGTPTSPFFDIKEVSFHDETADDFKITLEVDGNLIGSPAGGVAPTAQHFYDVHFTLVKVADPQPTAQEVTYVVRAWDELATKNFTLNVLTGDGTTRPNTGMADDIDGVWDALNNTITWTVPKTSLNVSGVPAEGADVPPRNDRGAKITDILTRWAAYVYERPGLVTPDGIGVYNDTAQGECFLELEK